MKKGNIILLAGLLVGFAANVLADGDASATPKQLPSQKQSDQFKKGGPDANSRPKNHGDERALLLKRLLDLPPERLDMMQATIHRIQSLSDEDKARLRERLEYFDRMPVHEKRRLLENFRNDERKRWDEFRTLNKHLPPDQRKREQRRIYSLPPHERRDYFDQLRRNKHPKGGLHPPPHPPRRENSPPVPHRPQR